MDSLFLILLKVSGAFAVFYTVYWLFLRKETFFKLNRFYLVLALLVSSVLPLFPVYYQVDVQPEKDMKIISAFNDGVQSFSGLDMDGSASSGLDDVFLIIYLTGVALFFFRLIIQTMVISRLILKSKIIKMDGLRIVENDKYGLPFSFFRLIFINPKFHKQADLNDILSHERVHVDQNHWVDLIIVELLTVIFWFNPFIWLFERSIKQNHEYLADRGVLTRGLDLSRYQALLINQLMGMQIIGVTNNLNFALNTNRLKMMTKMQSKKIRLIRLIVVLPALFLLMVAFAKPNYQYTQSGTETETLKQSLSMKETIVVKGVVKAEDDSPLPGASVIIKGTTIGVVSDIDGKFSMDVPKSDNTVLVVSFVGFATEEAGLSGVKNEINKEIRMKRAQILIGTEDVDKVLSSPPPPPPPPVSMDNTDKREKEVFFVVEEMPSYPGGHYALMQYYREMSKKLEQKLFLEGKKTSGKALVGFTVNAKGKVTNIKVLKKDNDTVAKAAVTLVENMKDWTPGKQRGKSVPVDFVMPLKFD